MFTRGSVADPFNGYFRLFYPNQHIFNICMSAYLGRVSPVFFNCLIMSACANENYSSGKIEN